MYFIFRTLFKLLVEVLIANLSQLFRYKNGVRIIERAESNVEIARRRLTIEEAQEDDSGEYMCIVEPQYVEKYIGEGRIFRLISEYLIFCLILHVSALVPNRDHFAKNRKMEVSYFEIKYIPQYSETPVK